MEELIKKIQLINDSKSIHTRNKAIFYLNHWNKKKNKKRIDNLTRLCNEALLKNDWDIVKKYLRVLW